MCSVIPIDQIVAAPPYDTGLTEFEPAPSSVVLFCSHFASFVIHSLMIQPSLSIVALLFPCLEAVAVVSSILLVAVTCLTLVPSVVLKVYQSKYTNDTSVK